MNTQMLKLDQELQESKTTTGELLKFKVSLLGLYKVIECDLYKFKEIADDSLTQYQTTNFRLFQILKAFADDNFSLV